MLIARIRQKRKKVRSMKKFSIFLVLCLLLTFSACGSKVS